MKQKFFQLILFALVLMMASTVLAAKKTPDEQRAELNGMSEKVLARMYEKYPESKAAVRDCYAYCTISASGVKLGLFGDDHGRGVVVNCREQLHRQKNLRKNERSQRRYKFRRKRI